MHDEQPQIGAQQEFRFSNGALPDPQWVGEMILAAIRRLHDEWDAMQLSVEQAETVVIADCRVRQQHRPHRRAPRPPN